VILVAFKANLSVPQHNAPKRSTAKSPVFATISDIRITHCRATKRIELQTQPTPLPTPARDPKLATIGFGG
jgi:hypothetical protein